MQPIHAAPAWPVHHHPEQQRFTAGAPAGESVLDYRLEPGSVVFTHTYVPPAARGQGLAAKLVDAGLAWAAQSGREPRAECSYVAAVLARRR